MGPLGARSTGLTAHPSNPSRLYAVTDEDSPPLRILEVDVAGSAARVIRQINVNTPGLEGLDIEGIVAKPNGGFWLASEGKARSNPPNVLLEVDANGLLLRSLPLPEVIANRVEKKGLEGVALEVTPSGSRLYIAFQAPLAGDPEDVTRIGAVDLTSGQWSFYYYPLERRHRDDFTGLSELLHLGNGRFAAIERDGRAGRNAIKWLTTFDLGSRSGAPPEGTPSMLTKQRALDLVPLFIALGRKVEKEIEGLAVAVDGQVYAITDNDNGRPTLLLRLGKEVDLFGCREPRLHLGRGAAPRP